MVAQAGPLEAFIWGANGTAMTPEEIAKQRALEDAIAARGVDTSPVEHWTQGAARVAEALAGVVRRRRLDGAAKESGELGQGAFSEAMKAFGAGSGGATDQAAATAPYTTATAGTQTADVGDLSGNDVFSGFMGTVKAGGVQNPYALAAIAATGKAESGFDPGNINRTWSDPSQSGKPGRAGGIMSWRGPRFEALAATGDLTPQGQAKFFLQEDPKLIAALNGAKSVEEAQSLMNRAWAFAGYDKPGGETARRMQLAASFAPQFQGQGAPTEVASLDPSAGMAQPQTAAQAIEAQAPSDGGSLSDEVAAYRSTPEYAAQFPGAQPTGAAPAFDVTRFGSPALTGLEEGLRSQAAAYGATSQQPSAAPAVIQPAPAVAQPVQVAGGGGRPSDGFNPYANEAILKAMSSPHLSAGQRAVMQAMLQRQQAQQEAAMEEQRWMRRQQYEQQVRASDPANALDLDYKRAQLEALKAKPQEPWQKLDDDTLFRPSTGETRDISATGPGGVKPFRFTGNGVEAQSLNGLIDSGQLTPGQAQQLGAGKTVTGPNGEVIFMTPQGVFSQSGNASEPQPVPVAPQGQSASPTAPAAFPQAPASARSAPQPRGQQGMIPLTEPKVTIDEKKAMTFADRMKASGTLIDQNGAAGEGLWDTAVSKIPVAGNYMVSDEYQSLDQARRDFINAQLRRESGAVISPEEFDNARKQYFPQPGDSPATVEQKRRNRETVIKGMARDGGPTYGAQSPTKSDPLAAARDAIAKGAPRAAVIERLRQRGINPEGL